MESNRRPGKNAPKKKASADNRKPSAGPRAGAGRSASRSTSSDKEILRVRPNRTGENRPPLSEYDKPGTEHRSRQSSSEDRSPRRDFDKPSSDERPHRSSSKDRPPRRAYDKPGSEVRPRRSSSEDRPPSRAYDEPGSEVRPRRSSSEDRPPSRAYDEPGSEIRPRRSSSEDRPPRRAYDEPGSEVRPRRSSSEERPARRAYDKPGSEVRPRRSSSEDRPPRRSSDRPGSENRPLHRSNSKSSGSSAGEGLIRLNKYIANSGICSRREADELIVAGAVSVNGKIVTELGTKVSLSDNVKYDNRTIRSERLVYVLLNKPKGYLTTTDDPFDRKTVMTLVANACKERIYPVGRLDRNTSGLLLLTNDGDMAKKLTHPKHNVRKVYHVELDKALTKSDMMRIVEGMELDDGVAMIDEIAYADEGKNKKEVGVELHSGRNRIVRRIFEAVGYEVVKLDRVIFAGLTKKDLPRGHWRLLTEQEVNYLKMLK